MTLGMTFNMLVLCLSLEQKVSSSGRGTEKEHLSKKVAPQLKAFIY